MMIGFVVFNANLDKSFTADDWIKPFDAALVCLFMDVIKFIEICFLLHVPDKETFLLSLL